MLATGTITICVFMHAKTNDLICFSDDIAKKNVPSESKGSSDSNDMPENGQFPLSVRKIEFLKYNILLHHIFFIRLFIQQLREILPVSSSSVRLGEGTINSQYFVINRLTGNHS